MRIRIEFEATDAESIALAEQLAAILATKPAPAAPVQPAPKPRAPLATMQAPRTFDEWRATWLPKPAPVGEAPCDDGDFALATELSKRDDGLSLALLVRLLRCKAIVGGFRGNVWRPLLAGLAFVDKDQLGFYSAATVNLEARHYELHGLVSAPAPEVDLGDPRDLDSIRVAAGKLRAALAAPRQYTLRFEDGSSVAIQAFDDADANHQASTIALNVWRGSDTTTDVVVIDDMGDHETITVQIGHAGEL